MPDAGHGPAADEGRPSVANVPSTIASAGEATFSPLPYRGPQSDWGHASTRRKECPGFLAVRRYPANQRRPFLGGWNAGPERSSQGSSPLWASSKVWEQNLPWGRAEPLTVGGSNAINSRREAADSRISPFLPLLARSNTSPLTETAHAPRTVSSADPSADGSFDRRWLWFVVAP